MFPKVAAIIDYITQNPSDSQAALQQYRKAQHPDNRRAAREKIINVLHGRIQQGNLAHASNIEELADHLTGDYWPDSMDDHSVSICHLQGRLPPQDAPIKMLQSQDPHSSQDLQMATLPIGLPNCRMMKVPRTRIPSAKTDITETPIHHNPQRQVCITQGTSRMDN